MGIERGEVGGGGNRQEIISNITNIHCMLEDDSTVEKRRRGGKGEGEGGGDGVVSWVEGGLVASSNRVGRSLLQSDG